jgi:predicted Rossmann fold nucleotide-binding protein DprA/Smf involved in DNA uptake
MSPVSGAGGAELLTRLTAEIAARLQELRAAVEEHEQLVAAMDALGAQGAAPAPHRSPVTRAKAASTVKQAAAAPRAAPRTKAAVTAKAKAPVRTKAPAKAKVTPAKAKAPVKAKAPAQAKAPVKAKAPAQAKAHAASTKPESGDHQAILAALEHGSHTVPELAVVTAMSGPSIREALKGLSKAGRVKRATREGKAAYVLAA